MARIAMSLVQPHKRQSKINWKLAISKTDDGIRITVMAKRIGLMAQKLNSKYADLENDGSYISGEFTRLNRSLNFYYRDLPRLTLNGIPNLSFINKDDIVNEGEIYNVFTEREIKEWIELFQVFLKLMKKYTRRFDLL